MALVKSKGPKLFFSRFGGEQPIPPEFIAAMERTEEIQAVPNDIDPEVLSDTIIQSDTTTNRTDERIRKTIKKKPGNITLLAYNTNDQGQPVQVSRTLLPTGDLATFPDATQDVALHDLGNGWSIQEVSIEGVFIMGVFTPELFTAASFTISRPDPLPEEFRVAAPVTTTAQREEGTAVMPTLGTGDLEASEKQTTEFVKEVSVTNRDDGAIPTLVDLETTPDKQLATTTKDIITGTSLVTPTALRKVRSHDIGDGRSEQDITLIDEILPLEEFSIEIPDPIPPRFRVLSPATTESFQEEGTAVLPTLGTGDLSKSQRQLDAFLRRVSTTHRDPSGLPVSLTSYKLTPDQQVETVVETLDVGLQTISAVDETTIEANVDNLGNNLSLLLFGEVPNLFSQESFSIEIPDPIPPRFRILSPATTTEETVAGTAALPTLGTGDLSKSERQLTEFKKRLSTTNRDPSDLPVSLVSYKVTPDKQIETVTETLDVGLQTIPSLDELTTEANVDNLGNNLSLLLFGEVPALLPLDEFSVEVQDPVPLKFRLASPATTHSLQEVGTAVAPTLGTGDLSKSERQLNAFIKRVSATNRDPADLPVSLVSYKLTPDQQIETVTETLDTGLQTIPTVDETTTEANVDNLGNNLSLLLFGEVADLFSQAEFSLDIPDPIPPRFRVISPAETTAETVPGTAAMPTLGTGDLSKSERQLTEFKKRVTATNRDPSDLPVSLTSYKLTADKQIETVVETLDVGLQTIAGVDETTAEANVDNLGNNLSLLLFGAVPDLFDPVSFAVNRPDSLPEEFRVAAPATTEKHRVAGTATLPVLGAGDLDASERQIDEFVKETSLTNRDDGAIPTLIDLKTNQFKQIVTVTKDIISGTSLVTPNAETDVVSRAIGDGRSVQEISTIDNVFENKTTSQEIADLIPPEFKGVVPTYATEITLAGVIVDPPVLGVGDLEKTEIQVDIYTKKVRTRGRGSISLPITLTGGQKLVEKYGVQLLANSVITLGLSGTLTIPTGFLVVEAEKREIGGGMEIATSLVVPTTAWPIETSLPFDEEMQVRTRRDEQIVDPVYVPVDGTNFTESIRAVDQFHSRRIRITKVPTAVSQATSLVTTVSAPFQFPGTLNVVQAAATNAWLGYRAVKAELVEQVINTWWVNSPIKPTIAFDEILSDSIVIVGVDRIERFHGVLHDGYTAPGAYSQFFPPTKPSYTEYFTGSYSGGTVNIVQAAVTNVGTGYTVGDILTGSSVNGSWTIKVFAVGVSNSITAVGVISSSPGTVGESVAVSLLGGTGTGAQATIATIVGLAITPGTAWIGTPRVVSADVKPTEIKNQWKIQTRTVVMR